MKKRLLFLATVLSTLSLFAQPRIVSGPMLGPVELRDAKIWVEVSPEVKSVALQYNKKGDKIRKTIVYKGALGNALNPLSLTVGGLDYNTAYEYRLVKSN